MISQRRPHFCFFFRLAKKISKNVVYVFVPSILFGYHVVVTIIIINVNRTWKGSADKQALVGNGLYRLSG